MKPKCISTEMENRCKWHFKKLRDEMGVTCKNCGSSHHYWISTTEQYKCSECGTRSSLRSGTILQNSKLPYTYWYKAMRFVYSDKTPKKGLITRLQEKLLHKRYSPIWILVDKIHNAVIEDRRRYASGRNKKQGKRKMLTRKIEFPSYFPLTPHAMKKIIIQ